MYIWNRYVILSFALIYEFGMVDNIVCKQKYLINCIDKTYRLAYSLSAYFSVCCFSDFLIKVINDRYCLFHARNFAKDLVGDW